MPLYHFNVDNSLGLVEDEEGRELPDLEAARGEALNGIRSILAEDVRAGWLDLRGRLLVLDADRKLLLTIRFAEALEIRRQAA